MALTQVRQWSSAARNSTTTVYYEDTDGSLSYLIQPIDAAYGFSGGAPSDGFAANTLLTAYCEGTALLSFYAKATAPFATLTRQPGAPACDGSTLALVRATGFAPIAPATTGRVEVQGSGGVAPYTVKVGTVTATAGPDGLATVTGLAPGAYAVTLSDSAPAPTSRTGSVVVPAADVPGCPLPTALNYNPNATSNDGSCVFVAVDSQPAGLVAAHLPIAVRLRAAPISGQPALVYLFLETAPTAAGPWSPAGTKRSAADPVTATTEFNISEEVKALFTAIAPPAETGLDATLSRLVRLRYVVRDPATSADRYGGTLAPFRALNTVLAPPADGVLATGPYWNTTATLADGVLAAVGAGYTGCPGRVLVWLNRAGAWEQGVFSGRHIHGDDQSEATGYRDSAGADRYASKGTVRDTLQVYSDKLDFATYQYLRGIRRAVQVYERTAPGQYVPVLVASGSFTEYQEQTDKTFEVNFTISYPPVLIQTQ